MPAKLLFVATEDWYFSSHRLPLARAAVEAGYHVAVATREAEHGDAIRETGSEVFQLTWTRGGGQYREEFSTVARLMRICRTWRPTLVHNIALKPVLLGSLAARLSGVRPVVNAIAGLGHAFSASGVRARAVRLPLQGLLALALRAPGSRVIVQNPDDRDRLTRSGLAHETDIVLIRGAGVDLEEFRAVAEPQERPVVVMLPSRMLWSKGVQEFVEAARILRRNGSPARFVLVGRADHGNPAAIQERTLEAWHREGTVEWWGHRSNMATTLAQSHIVCLPSAYGEGIPKVLCEAAACGRPIVTTDAPGCRECVQSGVNGLLVPVRDGRALAQALERLVEDRALRASMGLASRRLAEQHFGVARIIAETMAVYRDVLA